ncbi:cytochrome-c peroxidase [Dyadobacter sp. CY345]|uniref:cytochrome-c peroxidase n=1 Tax=Dyadobacter sp. CY345 TaxID=2909335 RepID=UPI001F334BEF|nr:cytochrome c peroxidase [Dyadobacter sp. CY345]MCF2443504.1 cytochrome-c peroxidase [Dyadobacter sp. CY345]
MKFLKKNLLYTVGLSLVLTACGKEESVDPEPLNFQFVVPDNFPQPVWDTENPMTRNGIELGRMLFYDVRLSGNNKISCASCHDQKLAFSDGKALSSNGVSGTVLHRHTPALINLAWANNGLFWDGGSTNLESQAFGPLTAADEMQQDLFELVDELNNVPEYVKQFDLVFEDKISSQNIVKALAQFQRTLVSSNSRYDKFRRNEPGGDLSPTELHGLELVRQKCQSCHAGELFTDNSFHNNGIDADFDNDQYEGLFQGRFRVSYNPADLGSFKTPTLRNVALTAPYMHDGRFTNLEDVIDHYSQKILVSPTLDKQIPNNGFQFSVVEKEAIMAFLKTLTDEEFVTNSEFSSPR